MTAAELVLGLLDGEARAVALRRILSDRAFAADVEGWRAHFGQLFDIWPEILAPTGVAERIENTLFPGRARGWAWPVIAVLSTAVAAILLVVTLTRPTPVIAPPTVAVVPMLAAAIQPVARGEPVAVVYEPATGTMRVGGIARQAGHAEQLWMIAGNAAPRSLGLLAANAQRMPVAPPLRAAMDSGVTLAISIEPIGGSPTGLPTGPVIATGKLQRV